MVYTETQKVLTIDVVIPSIRMDPEVLTSLLRIAVPKDVRLHYYVVIDNPSDSIKNLQLDEGLVRLIINEQNLGAPASRNVGLESGTGEYVLFLDDDVTPSPDILQAYVSAIRAHPDAPGYVGQTKFPNPTNSFTRGVKTSDILTFFDISTTRDYVAWGTTSNLLLNKRHVGDIRFSSKFPNHGGGEDIDFCLRIIAKNGQWFRSVPDAIVYHGWWRNGRRSYTRFFRWAFGDSRLPRIHLRNKYYNFPNMIELLVLGLPIMTGLGLAGLISSTAIGIWVGLVFLSEFIVEGHRARTRYRSSSVKDGMEATVIRLSNDLGRVAGFLRRGDIKGFFERFDYIITREWIPFERRNALKKFILFCLALTPIFLL